MFNLFRAISTLSFASDKFSLFIFFNTLFKPFSDSFGSISIKNG